MLGAGVATAQPGPPSFEQIDKDKNGALSPGELTEFFNERRAGGGQPPGPGGGGPPGGRPFDPAQIFGRWDSNGDGSVSKAEFDARPRQGGGPGGAQRQQQAEPAQPRPREGAERGPPPPPRL
jgi:hypothetical protein